ncbi:MAG: tetratricopeptide repeat protein [Anaerolineae bacterium]|nr:tetratricopeptide repeat protein [Anaerolineae bacterium]
MAGLSMWFLGGFRVSLDGGPGINLKYDKVRALLAYLALESERPHRREALAGLLWPELSERRARRNLSQVLYVLRSALEGTEQPCLQVTPQAVQFDPACEHWLDVRAFTSLLSACQEHAHWQLETCPACGERLARAAALYAGPFLHGLSLGDSPAFEEWQLVQREHLHQLAVDALAALAGGYEARGEVEQALQAARRWVELEPWHEAAHRQAMRALASSGRRNAALAQYQACRQALTEELGIEPAAATVALYEQIRDGSDTGFLEAPQVTETRYLDRRRKHNLPAPATPFVGREETLAELTALLQDPGCRLVTLVGPGGIGKTRLALQLAEEAVAQAPADRFPDGVYFVPLAPVHTVDGAVSAVVQALGLSLPRSGEPKQHLLRTLRDRRMLLVLDNVEQLTANGGEGDVGRRQGDGVELLLALLRGATGVRLLVTSRARLNVSAEQVLAVPGLDVPPPPDLMGSGKPARSMLAYSGVQLYLQQARRVRPGYEPDEETLSQIGRICRILAGMPLAIVLAAAWSDVLSPGEIAAELGRSMAFLHGELRDLPARHRSMVATFDVSWAMLGEAERQAFAALSVFRGGFTREAAQQVAGADLEMMRGLVHKSFLTGDEHGRHQMHELLRQYGAEQLARTPEEEWVVRDRHCAHYASTLQRWVADLKSSRQQAALTEMQADIDNARVAWEWAVGGEQLEWLSQAMEGLGLFYDSKALYQDGVSAFRMAADRLAGQPHHVRWVDGSSEVSASCLLVRARALTWQSRFCHRLGRNKVARELLRESLDLLEALTSADTRRERAFALFVMGQIEDLSGERQNAWEPYMQALALYRELDGRWEIAEILDLATNVPMSQGEFDVARELLQEAVAIRRELGDQRGLVASLSRLANTFGAVGQFEDWEWLNRKALAIARDIGDRASISLGLLQVGGTLMHKGEFVESRSLLEEGMRISGDLGTEHFWAHYYIQNLLGITLAHLGQPKEGRRHLQQALALAQKADEAWPMGFILFHLGLVALGEGDYAGAWQFLQEGIATMQRMGQTADVGRFHALLAGAARGLDRLPQAREFLCRALELFNAIGDGLIPLYALPVAALLLADLRKVERAVEIYALACRYGFVAHSRLWEDIAGHQIAALAATLSPDVVATAQERGRARDLKATISELLAELAQDTEDTDTRMGA